ncbi:MAG: undecaprenyldiphospho-muramoylpentapeptide beta-N-acetylglucosaminyltransferase [Lachnospiraceae bacterium]|nr:undecaprenyldiphospho-muramoylpentapeptide beta-N-acetylglucosaminyltransferase [Lachnospiraceae bacterium]
MKKIILTGGGTAGHVTPNIALVPKLKEAGYTVEYIGSYNGMEKDLVENAGLKYYGISSGKLRRYFSLQNFTDPFRVIKGYFEAKKLMKELKPDVLFSKGGFVTVPVVMAAHAAKVPAVIHESDMTPGLANKIATKFATKVCHTFPETGEYVGSKGVFTGSPIRAELFTGDKIIAMKMCDFDSSKPVLLVTGGSLGAKKVNDAIREALPELLKTYQVAHLCGKEKYDKSLEGTKGYAQFEYISAEMKDFFAMADIIVSRAGSNSICEIAALHKPNVLIPLSAKVSRGDQILNSKSFEKQGLSKVLDEDTMTTDTLVNAINEVYDKRADYIDTMKNSNIGNGIDKIIDVIMSVSK